MSGPSAHPNVAGTASPAALPALLGADEASPAQSTEHSTLEVGAPLQVVAGVEDKAPEQRRHVLGRRFVVVRKAGSGGCSQVLTAQDTQSGELVAVKLLHEVVHSKVPYPMGPLDVLSALQSGTMPWQREWEAYERLGGTSSSGRAPCIPSVYEAGVVNKPFRDEHGQVQPRYFCYLVMELLGHNLYERYAAYGKHRTELTAQEFVVLGQAMLRALQHVHTCGLVHRDVKPSNFCLPTSTKAGTADGALSSVYIMDFDFATTHDATLDPDSRTRFLGTPDYASVRTLRSYHQTPLDDLEALCYSLVEVATGDLPWGEIAQEVSKRPPSEDGLPWNGWRDNELEQMASAKERMFGQACEEGLVPFYLSDWMDHLHSLPPHAQPDYSYLAQLLECATHPSCAGGPEVWHGAKQRTAAITDGGLEGSGGKRARSGDGESGPAGKRSKRDTEAADGPGLLEQGEE